MRFATTTMLSSVMVSSSAFASMFPIVFELPSIVTQQPACTHTSSEFNCVEFLYNYDGDTINVRIPDVHPLIGEKISVRVAGVDTPELVSADPCERVVARESRNLVRSLLSSASRIDLTSLKRDKYFRILADVIADGESVAQVLLAHGLAYPYNGGPKARIDWCEISQR
jgi:endonuclease YncB( thermonuclease family)